MTPLDARPERVQEYLSELVSNRRTSIKFQLEAEMISKCEFRRQERLLNDLNRLGAGLPDLLAEKVEK